MRTSSRSPYEVRLELLQLATEILLAKHKANANGSHVNTSPTTEEVIAEAEKMNVFVSKAHSSQPY